MLLLAGKWTRMYKNKKKQIKYLRKKNLELYSRFRFLFNSALPTHRLDQMLRFT